MIKIVRNFISEEEAKKLSEWTNNNYKEPFFTDPKMNSDSKQTRFTTRHAHGRIDEQYKNYQVKYCEDVYKIQSRICEYLNLNKNNFLPFPSFTDGIVTTICFPPGSCSRHKDPIYYPNSYTLHCNFCTQQSENGGVTLIEGKKYHFNKTDMIMYVSSHLDHEVTECVGETPRILWVYGFSVNKLQLNKIFNIRSFSYN